MIGATRIEGTLQLPVPVCCTSNVLGTKHLIQVAGRTGIVATPVLPGNFGPELAWVQLAGPPEADERVRVGQTRLGMPDDELNWGRPWRWPSLESMVRAVQVWFPIAPEEADPTNVDEIAERVRKALPAWTSRLLTGVELLSSQILDALTAPVLPSYSMEFFLVTEQPRATLLSGSLIDLTIRMPSAESAATSETWATAVRAASEEWQPRIEHLLLRDARLALGRSEFRRAVIDAASALEIALTTRLSARLSSALDRHAAETILGRAPGLGSRLRLARALGLPAGSRGIEQELVIPRNRAAHHGAALTRAEAALALQVATEATRSLWPSCYETDSTVT